ncbi:MAG TPA: hypothetical protein VMW72_07520, partial [Sedimentisphaerales bacterium]|nr:hypothetical protein [Sedimentisphaerales bacterium]
MFVTRPRYEPLEIKSRPIFQLKITVSRPRAAHQEAVILNKKHLHSVLDEYIHGGCDLLPRVVKLGHRELAPTRNIDSSSIISQQKFEDSHIAKSIIGYQVHRLNYDGCLYRHLHR